MPTASISGDEAMKRYGRSALVLVALAVLALPGTARGQDVRSRDDDAHRATVISANPFGILLEFFNAEVEHVVGPSLTAGVGGSYINLDDEDYLNLDAFLRFYPQGDPLNGWAFGIKAGITNVPDAGTWPGFGFDVNWSQLLGAEDRFYVGIGFGLKRLFGSREEFDTAIIPTLRIINVGWAF